ncbi:hypothetical protein L596_023677 [Steinernema carpocapsae]|uniref:F-box domain-containing protein n=1 Tax=Steinernema carpocapsae TaxID=34508 RepID=A0A4U5MEC5_STECR|nr:hypothetical protein L596_023677 [Steinernema carpocapsae]
MFPIRPFIRARRGGEVASRKYLLFDSLTLFAPLLEHPLVQLGDQVSVLDDLLAASDFVDVGVEELVRKHLHGSGKNDASVVAGLGSSNENGRAADGGHALDDLGFGVGVSLVRVRGRFGLLYALPCAFTIRILNISVFQIRMSLSLDRFPNEVLLQILAKCDVETLLEVRKVSERFNEVASKVLRDMKFFPIHLNLHSVGGNCVCTYHRSYRGKAYKKIFTIDAPVARSEDFDIGDHLPEFLFIDRMLIPGKARDKCFADAARILDSMYAKNKIRDVHITFTARLSKNKFKLLGALENKISKKLVFSWNDARQNNANISRELDKCLTMFKSNRGTLKKVRIKGHFSVAEMVDCFGQAEVGRFRLTPNRFAEGDLNAFPNLVESLVANPRKFAFGFYRPGLQQPPQAINADWERLRELLRSRFGVRVVKILLQNETWAVILYVCRNIVCILSAERRD